MTFDGATKGLVQHAVRDALIGFMAASAKAQAEAMKEAQRTGIDQAKVGAVGIVVVCRRSRRTSSHRCWACCIKVPG